MISLRKVIHINKSHKCNNDFAALCDTNKWLLQKHFGLEVKLITSSQVP